jgi:hypothetical protein
VQILLSSSPYPIVLVKKGADLYILKEANLCLIIFGLPFLPRSPEDVLINCS